MKRPNKNKIAPLRAPGPATSRVTYSNPVGDRQITYTQGDRTWIVTATKRLPWTVRAERRRANKIARHSRKRNRNGRHT